MKSRLRKIVANDEMSTDELVNDITYALKMMRNRVNEWTVRDTLLQFTSWGFYQGGQMASIDEAGAIEIIKQLNQHVLELEDQNDQSTLMEIYDIVYRYYV